MRGKRYHGFHRNQRKRHSSSSTMIIYRQVRKRYPRPFSRLSSANAHQSPPLCSVGRSHFCWEDVTLYHRRSRLQQSHGISDSSRRDSIRKFKEHIRVQNAHRFGHQNIPSTTPDCHDSEINLRVRLKTRVEEMSLKALGTIQIERRSRLAPAA